jgi:hypothetical protein
VLQRVLRDFTDFPKYLKREANRRRAADSVRIVDKPYLTGLGKSSPSSGGYRSLATHPPKFTVSGSPCLAPGAFPG